LNAKASATKVCPGCSACYPPDALFCPNDGSPLATNYLTDPAADVVGERVADGNDSYLGREISGHIEIRTVAGVGAMGRVYRAYQRGIDRDVAVKVLHRELSANQQLVARFHREAKVASRLQHPNVVQVHLAGQLPDGAMYIVMEYLDGMSLQSALASANGPFPMHRALHIALQICDAAGEAHAQGVIHRDIKPENVMLVRRGDDADFVKVLDFGIARLNWGEQSMATAAGLIFGTARYISPEGAQGEAVGPQGDVYAAATLVYQMLAGRTPFEGDQAVALLIQQIHDAPPPLRSIPAAANVPEPIAAVVMKNLSKSPAERAPDARAFGRALLEAAKSAGITAEELVPRSTLLIPHARLSDPGPPHASAPPPAELPRSERAPAPVLPRGPSQKTQAWTPPPASAATGHTPLPTSTPPPVAQTSTPHASTVDRTLDETSDVRAPVSPPRVRTEPALPLAASFAIPPTLPPPPVGPPAATVRVAAPMHAPEGPSPHVRPPPLAPMVEDDPPPPRRLFGVVVLCLLVGVLGAAFVLYQLGMVGRPPPGGSLEDVVARADEALRHARWDTPPGDNVRDITTEGLSHWPGEPRILELRARATDELVKEAVGRKFAGDLGAALHMAKLAKELDPSDTTAQHLVDEYERSSQKADVATLPLAPTAPPTPAVVHGGSSHGGAAGPARVVIEPSVARPRVGQAIPLSVHVAGPSGPARSIEEPRLTINGPGLGADSKLTIVPGAGGIFSSTFTGYQPGRYELAFDAKVDGTTLHATRPIVIEGDPSSSPSASAPQVPATVPSGKWL
jgi:serine/threonine-protein kinase